MNQLNIRIGKILRDHRQIKHLTQLDLSRKLGYESTQFVHLIECGKSKCPIKALGKLCKILDIDHNWMSDLILEDFKVRLNKELRSK